MIPQERRVGSNWRWWADSG